MASEETKSLRRAKAILNRLVEGKALSQDGMDFLVCALDPFHDSEVRLAGYPDIDSSRSVTQVVQVSHQITKPTGTEFPALWDVHIFYVPLRAAGEFKAASISNVGNMTAAVGTQTLLGGLNVIAVPAGQPWSSPNAVTLLNWVLPNNYSGGRHRMIGMAYEVNDVTAELYKQGTVTCYKQPMQEVLSMYRNTSGAEPTPVRTVGLPPFSSEAAAQFPNSRIWPAKEGCYCICTLNDVENPVTAPSWIPSMAIGPAGTGLCWTNAPGIGAGGTSAVYPLDNSGAIFTGLAATASLQLTVRYLIERFPDQDSPDLLVLSQPSPAYDPLALELYSRSMAELPSYCMVKENPLGEWFSNLLGTIGNIAPTVGRLLPIPGGSLLGDAIGAGAKAVSSTLRPSPAAQPASDVSVTHPHKAKPKKKKKH